MFLLCHSLETQNKQIGEVNLSPAWSFLTKACFLKLNQVFVEVHRKGPKDQTSVRKGKLLIKRKSKTKSKSTNQKAKYKHREESQKQITGEGTWEQINGQRQAAGTQTIYTRADSLTGHR